jgi:hypothetical protein
MPLSRGLPIPLSVTTCWPPAALSARLTAAVRVPLAIGLKVTLIVQLAPAANELPQLWVCANSTALIPVIAMLVMVKLAVPVFLRVTALAGLVVPIPWVEKVRLVGDRVTFVPEVTAVALVATYTARARADNRTMKRPRPDIEADVDFMMPLLECALEPRGRSPRR